jgi:hypothetical protein
LSSNVISFFVSFTDQVKGDGDPSCFTNVKDTGIPVLQDWCHSLTVSSRERAARNFLNHLKAFATSIQTYVAGIGDVTEADRERLRQKWESTVHEDNENADPFHGLIVSDDDDYVHPHERKPPPKVDAYGELIGVTPRLIKVYLLISVIFQFLNVTFV